MNKLAKALSICLLSVPVISNAAAIFSQNMSLSPLPTIASTSDFATNQQKADNFTLATSAELGAVSWLGIYGSGFGTGSTGVTDDFTIRIFSSTSNAPDSLLFSENVGLAARTDTNLDTGGLDLFSYQVNLASTVSLNAGETYWLSIINDNGVINVNDWRWTGFDTLSQTSALRSNDASAWSTTSGAEYQYELASVPIPAAVWLFGSALAGLFATRKTNKAV